MYIPVSVIMYIPTLYMYISLQRYTFTCTLYINHHTHVHCKCILQMYIPVAFEQVVAYVASVSLVNPRQTILHTYCTYFQPRPLFSKYVRVHVYTLYWYF